MYDDVLGKGVRPEKDTLWGGDEAAFGQGEDRQFLSCEWNSWRAHPSKGDRS